MRVLITGGSGFIGSHVAAVAAPVHDICSLDNHSLAATGADGMPVWDIVCDLSRNPMPEFKADIRDQSALNAVFHAIRPDAVIHFAGLKSAIRSVSEPKRYFDTNVTGTRNVLEAMTASGCITLVFSSSAAVYGMPEILPIPETHPCRPLSPYGQTKLDAENLIGEWAQGPGRTAVSLRYFNPGGCHPSGRIGEFAGNDADNLLPLLARAALDPGREFTIHGRDHGTVDGTPLRDFIHIMDLAEAHIAALEAAAALRGHHVFNVGSGVGATVLQLAELFFAAVDRPLGAKFANRRDGDISASVADCSRAEGVLGWQAIRSTRDIVESCMTWERRRLAWHGSGVAGKASGPTGGDG